MLRVGDTEVETCAQPWTDRQRRLHITHREAPASALALDTLLERIRPGSSLVIQADATSTVTAWAKGSKVKGINNATVPRLVRLHGRDILPMPLHIPGKENVRADYLSRKPDVKNYRLDPAVFAEMCRVHRHRPALDLFANRQNRQTQDFCSWQADLRSKGNAFQQDWSRTSN